ncbi:MAG: hypothetical protein ACK4Q4_08555 [Rhodocyclaceae bacterium]
MSEEALEYETTATQSEFCRALHCAFPDGVFGKDALWRVVGEGAAMEITLTPLPPRVIAALRLPRVAVRIRFTDGTLEQRQILLARLDRAMQRGGG